MSKAPVRLSGIPPFTLSVRLIERVCRPVLSKDASSCARLWVLTTNDNLDALRFYQRRGFRLARLRAGAVDDARRTLKPEIPVAGDHGIRIRDELILEKEVPL